MSYSKQLSRIISKISVLLLVELVGKNKFHMSSEICSNLSGFRCLAGRDFCILGLNFHICWIFDIYHVW